MPRASVSGATCRPSTTNSTNTSSTTTSWTNSMRPGGPYVLFNFAAEVRSDALKKFPDLHKILPGGRTGSNDDEVEVLDEKGALLDAKRLRSRQGLDDVHGARGQALRFRCGRIILSASPSRWLRCASGLNHTHTSIRLRRLGMTFGLDDLNFTNYFTRNNSTTSFQSPHGGGAGGGRSAGNSAGRRFRGRRVHA